MSDFVFNFSATDTQLRNFYEERKSVVWYVAASVGNNLFHSGTAFALDGNGVLMTCAHLFPKNFVKNNGTIHVHRLEDTRKYPANIIKIRVEWDMVLLQVNDLGKNCNYTRLSDNGNLSVDQTIVHIGNPGNLICSHLVGKVAYKCVDSPPIPTGETMSYGEYNPTVPIKRGYRIMGDKKSASLSQTVKERKIEAEDNKNKLDYRLPIVQTYTCGAKRGSSGGPVFDGRGDVVGMHIQSSGCYNVALHVSVLRAFFGRGKTKVADQVEGSGTKRKSWNISSAAGLEA